MLVFLHLGSRRVYLSQPTFHPDETWVMQQARNVTMWLDDHGIEAKYLIHDRDTKFTRRFGSRKRNRMESPPLRQTICFFRPAKHE